MHFETFLFIEQRLLEKPNTYNCKILRIPGLGLETVICGVSVVRPVIRVAVHGVSVGVVTTVETVSVVPVVTSPSQKQFYNYSLSSKLR